LRLAYTLLGMEVVAGTEPDEGCAVALTQTVRHARFAAEAQTLRKTKAPSCEGTIGRVMAWRSRSIVGFDNVHIWTI